MLAEYGANGSAASPQKEYGYRNGQLLITATASQAQQSTENVTWTNAANVTVTGNSLTKTNADNWDAGADSTKSLTSGDGYVEMTASETNKDRMFGWTHNETTASYTDLDFAIRPCDNGTIYVFESGANRGVVGSYVAGDKLRVSVESGVVKYYKTSGGTSTLLYTSSVTPAYPLTADAAFYTSGGTVTGAVISGNLSSIDLRWLVTDQLGTPRMIFDKTGSLSAMTRHDYLPFGEELYVGTGGRTTAQGYSGSDGVRQHFSGKERDNETGLDYFKARYYASVQGRFVSVDPITITSYRLFNPQALNGYSYVANTPLKFTDPTGKDIQFKTEDDAKQGVLLYQNGLAHDLQKYVSYKKNDDGTYSLTVDAKVAKAMGSSSMLGRLEAAASAKDVAVISFVKKADAISMAVALPDGSKRTLSSSLARADLAGLTLLPFESKGKGEPKEMETKLYSAEPNKTQIYVATDPAVRTPTQAIFAETLVHFGTFARTGNPAAAAHRYPGVDQNEEGVIKEAAELEKENRATSVPKKPD